jgi:hypothetical protein
MRPLWEEGPAWGENQPLHTNSCINSHNALQTLSHFLKTRAQFFIQQVCGWNVSTQIKTEETHLKTEDPYIQWNGPPGNKMIPCLQRVRFSFRKGPPLTLKKFHLDFTKCVTNYYPHCPSIWNEFLQMRRRNIVKLVLIFGVFFGKLI